MAEAGNQAGPGMAEVAHADGTRLRLARQARGLSQQQLAGVAGVTRQAVSAVESGHSDPFAAGRPRAGPRARHDR